MGRRIFQDGQEIVFEDLNAVSTALERQMYQTFVFDLFQRQTNAFLFDSFRVDRLTNTSIQVQPGLGFLSDTSQPPTNSVIKPCYKGSAQTINISSPDPNDDRIDIVVVRSQLDDQLFGNRNIKDPSTGEVSFDSVLLQKDWSHEIQLITGTPATSPTPPAVPTGYVKIAELYVSAPVGITNQTNITDTRNVAALGDRATIDTTGLERVPESGSITVRDVVFAIDAYLKNGDFAYTDYEILGSDPPAPDAGKFRAFTGAGGLFLKSSAGVVTPVGDAGFKGVRESSGDTNIQGTDFNNLVLMSNSGVATVTLDDLPNGFFCYLKRLPNSTANIVLDPSGAQTIEGQSDLTLTPPTTIVPASAFKLLKWNGNWVFLAFHDEIITSMIRDQNITTGKIADLAVTNGKIANGAIGTTQIANSAVTPEKTPFFSHQVVNIGGETGFDSGSLIFQRINNRIFCNVDIVLSSSVSFIATSSGFIPSEYRPDDIRPIRAISIKDAQVHIANIAVFNDGVISFQGVEFNTSFNSIAVTRYTCEFSYQKDF